MSAAPRAPKPWSARGCICTSRKLAATRDCLGRSQRDGAGERQEDHDRPADLDAGKKAPIVGDREAEVLERACLNLDVRDR